MFTVAACDAMANAVLRDRAFAGEIEQADLERIDLPTLRELEKRAWGIEMQAWAEMVVDKETKAWSDRWREIGLWIVMELNRRGERAWWQERAA